MNKRSFCDIDRQLDERINKIFFDCDLSELSNYDKRRMIFDYICRNGVYDFRKLKSIHGSRDLFEDLYLAIDEKPSICNGFSQYYKLLLEKVGIYSVCVVCDDGTPINHQLNLVRNDDDTYSFDDVTSVIVKRGSDEDFFDYDIDSANEFNQGNRVVFDDFYWVVLSTPYVHYLIDKKDDSYLKYGIEDGRDLPPMPSNIESYKSKIVRSKTI